MEGGVRQLMESYGPCRYRRNGVVSPLEIFIAYSKVYYVQKYRKHFQIEGIRSP